MHTNVQYNLVCNNCLVEIYIITSQDKFKDNEDNRQTSVAETCSKIRCNDNLDDLGIGIEILASKVNVTYT